MAIILMQYRINPKMPEMKPPRKKRLYELFQADENAQIVVDVKHVIRLTDVWALKCDKTEAEPKARLCFLRGQLQAHE